MDKGVSSNLSMVTPPLLSCDNPRMCLAFATSPNIYFSKLFYFLPYAQWIVGFLLQFLFNLQYIACWESYSQQASNEMCELQCRNFATSQAAQASR